MDGESTGQRKIELQTNEDLSYLISNVRRAATARLNEAFPVVEGEDELREHIEALVNEVRTHYGFPVPHMCPCMSFVLVSSPGS